MSRVSRKHLSVVPPEADEDEVVALVESTIASWTKGQKKCRGRRRHDWRSYTVTEHRGSGAIWFEVTEVCRDCANQHRRDLDSEGYWMGPWRPVGYSANYLLPRGSGGLRETQQARLRLAEVLGRGDVIRVEDAS